jgi:hypothetical protein
MKVAELIELLQECPQNYEVAFEFEAKDKYGYYEDLACANSVHIKHIDKVVILTELYKFL